MASCVGITTESEGRTMIITVITSGDGKIVGTLRRRQGQPAPGIQSSLRPLAGQNMHEIEVPDHFMDIEDPTELHRRVAEHLPAAK